MKKFLTVLLVIAVMFTFSFSSAFATTIDADDLTVEQRAYYVEKINAEIINQTTYMANAKQQVVNQYAQTIATSGTDDGFTTIDAGKYYTLDAIKAAADIVEAAGKKVMTDFVSKVANGDGSLTGLDKATYGVSNLQTAMQSYVTATGFKSALDTEIAKTTFAKQAEINKKFVEDALAVYASKEYDNVETTETIQGQAATRSEYVAYLIKVAKADLDEIATNMTNFANDKAKADAYFVLWYDGSVIKTGSGAYTTESLDTGHLSTNTKYTDDNGYLKLLEAVPTVADDKDAESENAKDVAGAVNGYLQYGIGTWYGSGIKTALVKGASLPTIAASNGLGDGVNDKTFWTAATATTKAKFFGVEVAYSDKITADEATAIKNAIYKAIEDSAEVLKANCKTAAKVQGLYDGYTAFKATSESAGSGAAPYYYEDTNGTAVTGGANLTPGKTYYHAFGEAVGNAAAWSATHAKAEFVNTLASTTKASAAAEKVTAYGESLKAAYTVGVKVYDDEKVDKVVAKALKLVYADLGTNFDLTTVGKTYFDNGYVAIYGGPAGDYPSIKAVANDKAAFEKAIRDAQAKMFDLASFNDTITLATLQGSNDTYDAEKVLAGAYKTPEADFVYLMDTYAAAEADDWAKIAYYAYWDLHEAQTYDEIEAIMAQAAKDFAELQLATYTTMSTDVSNYKTMLDSYIDAVVGNIDKSVYDEAAFTNTTYGAKALGYALIDDATSLEGIKSAYAEAVKIVDNVKTKAELAADAKAVIAAIDALPSTTAITAADLEACKDAYAKYEAYCLTAGAQYTDITNAAMLKLKLNAAITAEQKAIEDAAEALNDKLAATSTGTEEGLAAYLALKADAQALSDRQDAIEDFEYEANLNKAATNNNTDFVNTVIVGAETAVLQAKLGVDGSFYAKEKDAVTLALVAAAKEDSTVAEKRAAIEAYNKLTDRQKYDLTTELLPYITVVENALANDLDAKAYVQDLSIKARSTKTSKGVKVTIKADVQELLDNGYTVEYKFYRSTKSNAKFGSPKITKTTNTYLNTSGKKGTRYYYKARLVVKNAKGEVVAITPLSQCLYATRVF